MIQTSSENMYSCWNQMAFLKKKIPTVFEWEHICWRKLYLHFNNITFSVIHKEQLLVMKRGVDVDIIYSNSPLLEMLNHHQYHQWIYTEWFTPQCQFPARPLQWQLIAFCQILLSLEYLWRYDDSVCSKYSQALNSSVKWKYLLMSYAQPHIV